MNTGLAAAMCLSLEKFGNQELSALHIALSWQSKLPECNLAFKAALASGLVNGDGSIPAGREELSAAVEHEVEKRIEAGTYT